MEASGNNVSPCGKPQTSICGQEIVLSVISDDKSQKSTASWSEFDSTENVYASDIVKMEEGATYKNTDEKILKEETEVLLISPLELFKYLKRPDESPESYQWYAHLKELMKDSNGRLVRHSQSNGKSRKARLKNLLEDENAQSICFWVTLCMILSITVVILIVLSQMPSVNIYYNYD